MTPAREAIVLPVLFLTVTLVGGLRIAGGVALIAPSLFSLVLGFLLLGVLVRSGALAPGRLMSGSRAPLANLNGFIVLLTTVLASAQMFSLMTPERGLPRIGFALFFLVLICNTLAAAPDRARLLRSLTVIFGSAFLLKFVVLAALSDPTGGRLKRVLQVLLEGVTLGTLTQEVVHPVSGYVALLALVLFLAGLALLPPTAPTSSRAMQLR